MIKILGFSSDNQKVWNERSFHYITLCRTWRLYCAEKNTLNRYYISLVGLFWAPSYDNWILQTEKRKKTFSYDRYTSPSHISVCGKMKVSRMAPVRTLHLPVLGPWACRSGPDNLSDWGRIFQQNPECSTCCDSKRPELINAFKACDF